MWLRSMESSARKIRLSLKKTSIHQVFGKHIYQADLWKVNRQSLSRGLAWDCHSLLPRRFPFKCC